MISISLCMIVKNEEKILERCLSSVHDLVDEIIIVDTGSTDDTKQIARKFTNHIYDFKWIDDFAAARNFSFSKATKDYQMWLDADDILEDEDREKFKILKHKITSDIDVVLTRYNSVFDENNIPVVTHERERLVKTKNNYKWIEPVHERIEYGNDRSLRAENIFITHKKENPVASTGRNMKIYEKQLKNGISLSLHANYQFAMELRNVKRYVEAAFYIEKYLRHIPKNGENVTSAYFHLAECYSELGKNEEAFNLLLESLRYRSPTAEICTMIGSYFRGKKEYKIAISWFKFACSLQKPVNSKGMMLHDYWGYKPNIELINCYLNLNDIEQAIYHHELAKAYKPNSEDVLNIENSLNKILSRINKSSSNLHATNIN